MDLESTEIGWRTRMIRRRRGLSLDVAAGLAGISKACLSMLELGQQGFNRRGLIEGLAIALGCSVADLTGQPYSPPDRASTDALDTIPEIGLALGDATLDDVPDVPARPVEQLVRLVDRASDHCDQTRFALAGRGLGALLTELHVHVVTGDTDTRRGALTALVEACEVAFTTTKYLGQSGIAMLAGRRGYDAAHLLDDPALHGFATYVRSNALTRMGERDRGMQLLTATIDYLAQQADPTVPDPAVAEIYGMPHLRTALYAARNQRAANARDHLAEAETIARRTGERDTLRLHFGPSNVAVRAVAVGVASADPQRPDRPRPGCRALSPSSSSSLGAGLLVQPFRPRCAEFTECDLLTGRLMSSTIMWCSRWSASIGCISTCMCDPVGVRAALDRAAAVGVSAVVTMTDADRAELERLVRQPRVVAVGETGLDCYWTRVDPACSPPEVQREAYRWHIDLAKRVGKPLMIHDRDAHRDVLAVLEQEGPGDGHLPLLLRGRRDGASLRGRRLHAVLLRHRDLPHCPRTACGSGAGSDGQLLVGTDAPFLTPHPHRGKPNEPVNLPYTVADLAALRGQDVAELATSSSAAAEGTFGFGRLAA